MSKRGSDGNQRAEPNGAPSGRLSKLFRPSSGCGDSDRNRPRFSPLTKAAAAGIGAIAILAAVTLYAVLPDRSAPEPVAAEQQRLGSNAVVFSIEGRDRGGRRGVFDVVVLDNSIAWVRESADALQMNGVRLAPGETVDTVLKQDVRDDLSGAQDIVGVGAVSLAGDPDEGIVRAGQRAAKTARIVSSVVAAWLPLWALNLGHYREPCAACETAGTSWQRPFMLVAVRSLEPDGNLAEALRDAMSEKSNMPGPSAYSMFELTRLR